MHLFLGAKVLPTQAFGLWQRKFSSYPPPTQAGRFSTNICVVEYIFSFMEWGGRSLLLLHILFLWRYQPLYARDNLCTSWLQRRRQRLISGRVCKVVKGHTCFPQIFYLQPVNMCRYILDRMSKSIPRLYGIRTEALPLICHRSRLLQRWLRMQTTFVLLPSGSVSRTWISLCLGPQLQSFKGSHMEGDVKRLFWDTLANCCQLNKNQ